MNCGEFQNQMHEYVEGSFLANARATAEQHLANCDACRRIAEKEKRLAQVLARRLGQSCECLVLSPEVRRNILTAARQREEPAMANSFIDWWRWMRLAAISGSLAVITIVLIAHFSPKQKREIVQVPVAVHSPVVSAPPGPQPPPMASIQISYRMPTYQFGQENGGVVDAVASQTVIANGTFRPGDRESIPSQLEMKTPL